MKFKGIILLALALIIIILPGTALASGDVVKATGDVIIDQDQRVYGDIVAMRGDVHIYGEVNGDVVALLGQVIVYDTGIIRGNAIVLAGGLEVKEGGQVHGDRVSLQISDITPNLHRLFPVNLFQVQLGKIIFKVLLRIALSVLVVALFPLATRSVVQQIRNAPAPSGGLGFLVWLVSLPLLVILTITIIGILLVIPLAFALYLAGILGGAALDLLLGETLLKSDQQPLASAALGALIFGLLRNLPLAGWLFALILSAVAVGAVTVTRFGTLRTGE